jgi:SAM-dependent methyltransferase
MPEIEDALRHYYDGEMASRAVRPLGEAREARLAGFVDLCHREGLSSVVEVGCGAGRDGVVLHASGLAYRGLDASSSSVDLCRGLGLDAVLGSALDLPFADDEFDAGWSMSTLMHLPGDGMATALTELRRVVRPGGVVEVGVWGADEPRERIDEHGRYFRHRTDDDLRTMLALVGDVTAFDTWSHLDDGGHYQWARVVVRQHRTGGLGAAGAHIRPVDRRT